MNDVERGRLSGSEFAVGALSTLRISVLPYQQSSEIFKCNPVIKRALLSLRQHSRAKDLLCIRSRVAGKLVDEERLETVHGHEIHVAEVREVEAVGLDATEAKCGKHCFEDLPQCE